MPNTLLLIRSRLLRALPTLSMLVFLLPAAGAARADFADCAVPGYLAGVDGRMSDVALPCSEASRFTIETPGGSHQVRIIYSTADMAPDLMEFVAAIRDGVQRSAATLRAIGRGTTADITIWASNLPRYVDGDVRVFAETRPIGAADSECVVAIFPGPNTAFTVAHEFFHCVQYATFGDKTYAGASDWWAEGSAQWFAELAVPGTNESNFDVGVFDSVSAETALTAMGEEAMVFFVWLGQVHGNAMAMDLIDAMPDGEEPAQQDALAAFLSEEEFLRFAEAYFDHQIWLPSGDLLPSAPFHGDIYSFGESAVQAIEAERFVLARFQIGLDCGSWTLARHNERGRWAVSIDLGPWQGLPESVSVPGPEPALWRSVAFSTGSDGFSVEVEAKRDACHRCGAFVIADESPSACLVGTWNLLSGGYGEHLQEQLRASGLFESIDYPDMESVLIINPDGTYEMPGPAEQYQADVRSPSGQLLSALGTLSMQSSGEWSVDGDTLTFCEGATTATIDLTVTDSSGNSGRVFERGGPDSGAIHRNRSFACDVDTLILVEDVPFMPTVIWEYTR